MSFLSPHTLPPGTQAFLFAHLSPDPHACYFHRSHLCELPITLHLARRLGAFEFVQPTIQRLGSLHPTLLDFDFGIIFHTDFQKWTVASPNPHATRLFLLIYITFPQLHLSNHVEGDDRPLRVHWVSPMLPDCCPGVLFTENFTTVCIKKGMA